MAQILYLFHENAADLFPRKVHHQDPSTHVLLRTRRHRAELLWNARTPVITEDLDAEDFPKKMSQFVEDITVFLGCLSEFPEFTDEVVNASMLAFQEDLKVGLGLPPRPISLTLMAAQYWASCLGQYTGVPVAKRDLPDSC